MNILKTISTLIFATVFISGAAIAENNKLSQKLADSELAISVEVNGCEADATIFCPGLAMNSQKSFMCLMAYEDHLSLACKLGIVEAAMALEMGMLAIDYSIKACEADADKYCLKVQPGEGRIVRCLRKNENQLNKECSAVLKETGLWNLGAK